MPVKLFFRRVGQGKPVVILHGLLGLSDNWVSFGRQLAADFEVFIPDLRNHGQSPHDNVLDYPALVEDLYGMTVDLKLRKMILIGHSMGGKTAMLFALKHQDLVDKLVVVDIVPRQYPPNMEHLMLVEAMMKVDLSSARSRPDVGRQLEEHIHSLKLRQFLLKNIYWKDAKTLDWRVNLSVVSRSLPYLLEAVNGSEVFAGPVLLVRGALSGYVTDADIEDMKKQFPRTSVSTLENASHWVHADAPGEFYGLVHDFLMT